MGVRVLDKVVALIKEFENKARHYHSIAEGYFLEGQKELSAINDRQAHVFEVCAAELRLALK
jgi:hypothetical protein